MPRRKGQTVVFEQVMLFGISVAIFLISFSVFTVYEDFFLDIGKENQLDQATEWVAGRILLEAEKENATSLAVIPVPRLNGDAIYRLDLSSAGLAATNLLTGETKNSTLYALNATYVLSGSTTSVRGKVTIKKEDRQMSLG